MITVPLLSQRDPRWANKKLGSSGNTIGGYGCLITSICMLYNYVGRFNDLTPDEYNTWLDRNAGYYKGNLYYWNRINTYSNGQIKWKRNTDVDGLVGEARDIVEAQVKAKIPVILQVDFHPETSEDDQHWVLYLGDEKIADPWTGRVENIFKYGGFKKVVEYVLHDIAPSAPIFKEETPVSDTNDRELRDLYYNTFFNNGIREVGKRLGIEYQENSDIQDFTKRVMDAFSVRMDEVNKMQGVVDKGMLLLKQAELQRDVALNDVQSKTIELEKTKMEHQAKINELVTSNQVMQNDLTRLKEEITSKPGTKTSEFKFAAVFTSFMTIGLPVVLTLIFQYVTIPPEWLGYLSTMAGLLTAGGFTAAAVVINAYIKSRSVMKTALIQEVNKNAK